MKYGNAIIREYPNYVNVSVFNYNVVDDTRLRIKKNSDKDKTTNENECKRIALLRARHKIFDIALLNDFQYFVTFTFNDKIVDAHDYEKSISKVKKWCDNQVQRKGLQYLIVPELHPSSQRIHLHGLLAWRDSPTLHETTHYDRNGRIIYNLPSWRFGYSTIIRLDDNSKDRIAKYITKYITKDLDKITGNYYYAGGIGLERNALKYYTTIDYNSFNGYESHIKDAMKVKYSLMEKDATIKLMYSEFDEFELDTIEF